ncbi:hypothetical protein KC320_g161 [Hortaea werneckii]|nr:hypothetical protein KC320_g161 [Hortaea werneckii]
MLSGNLSIPSPRPASSLATTLKRPGCWRWRTRTSRLAAGHRPSCSSETGGGYGTRSESCGTCCPCPCGCARGACGRRRPGKIEIACLLDQHVKVLGDLRCEAY